MSDPPVEEARAEVARLRLEVCAGRPPSWMLLGTYAGAIDAADPAWTDLADWVAWLVATYELSDWPSCWAQHHGLVQELTSLRVDHADCLSGSAHQCLLWHESLWQFVDRVTKISSRCLAGKRHSGTSPLTPSSGAGTC